MNPLSGGLGAAPPTSPSGRLRMPDYLTVQNCAEVELIVSRSRFIARCFPVQTEEEALARLERVKKLHYDATHNCYAYAVGERGNRPLFGRRRAGRHRGPAHDGGSQKRGITFCLVVVTRYFGGILLGAGGLVRAYTKSTADAVTAAGVLCVRECSLYSLVVPYPLWGKAEGWLRSGSLLFEEPDYAENVTARAAVPPADEQAFLKDCAELTDGKVAPVFLGKVKKSAPV